jgi:hypothetical protein
VSDTDEAIEANADEQVSGGEKSRPEWLQGEPDVDRLVSYADNLRNERASLRERLEQEAVWDDEEKAFERVKERFPHWLEGDFEETDDDDEEFEEDDPRDHKLTELEDRQKAHDEWIADQQNRAAMEQFKSDVDGLATDKEIELDDDDRTLIYRKGQELGGDKGWGRKELEQAFKWLVERNERIEARALERVKSSKRAPHVSAGGKAGKGPQPDLDTEAGRAAFYAERLGGGPAN